MKKTNNIRHSDLLRLAQHKRYGISKILVTTSLLLISVNSFANMSECINAYQSKNFNKTIEYCKPFINDNRESLGFTANAYTQLGEGVMARQYLLKYVNKYSSDANKNNNNNLQVLSGFYTGIGNSYYFGEYGATKNLKKGLKYITKGAELGNTTAQEQLGDFYHSNDGYPSLNVATSYKWYSISIKNGNSISVDDFVKTLNTQAPYCLAMGKQLVATAYTNGSDGLSKDTSQAKKYLNEAITLYKDNPPTAESYKYCAKQNGLDLASAEKLLKDIS